MSISKKNDDYPKMGKFPQKRNPKLDPHNKEYDPILARRRKKEKERRKANRQRRGR